MKWLPGELRKLREEAGLNQHQAAQAARIQHSSIQRWENGDTVPRVDTLNRVLNIYGYEVELVRKE